MFFIIVRNRDVEYKEKALTFDLNSNEFLKFNSQVIHTGKGLMEDCLDFLNLFFCTFKIPYTCKLFLKLLNIISDDGTRTTAL